MPRLSEARRQKRREQIAEATLRCFMRQGFAGTSMADIIAEAGLSAGSVYSHFASKAEVLRFALSSVLRSRLAALVDDLAAGGREVGPAKLLGRLLGALATEPAHAQMLLQAWGELLPDPELASLARENLRGLRDVIAKTLGPWVRAHRSRAGDAAVLEVADAVLAAALGYVVRIALDTGSAPADVLHGIVRTFGSKRMHGSARRRRPALFAS